VVGLGFGHAVRNEAMIKLTETREIAAYVWVHPDDDG
jgi:hypothetical protein